MYHVSSLTTTLWDWISTTGENKIAKNTNSWRLNNTLQNNKEVTEEIRKEIKRFLETNDNQNTTTQNLWDSAKAVLRGKFIAIPSYLKKQEKHNRQPNLTPKTTGKRTKLPKISRRKEIIKIRAEINEKEMKEAVAKINKVKAGSMRK